MVRNLLLLRERKEVSKLKREKFIIEFETESIHGCDALIKSLPRKPDIGMIIFSNSPQENELYQYKACLYWREQSPSLEELNKNLQAVVGIRNLRVLQADFSKVEEDLYNLSERR